jgi:hypothetical protein
VKISFIHGIPERGPGSILNSPGAREYPLSDGKHEIAVVILRYFSDNGGEGDGSRKGRQAAPVNENAQNETTCLPSTLKNVPVVCPSSLAPRGVHEKE